MLLVRGYRQALEHLEEARIFQETEDEDLRQLATAEIVELEPQIDQLERQIKAMLLPKDKRDERNVIVEIRKGDLEKKILPHLA